MLDIQLSEAKIFYDLNGQAEEVLISYNTFRHIEALLERLRREPDQDYFWSDGWQTRIHESEADIRAGRTLRVAANDINKALKWLDE